MTVGRRGESLVELIVALLVLEVAGTLALAGALAVQRIGRQQDRATTGHQERWQRYREAELSPACTAAPTPSAVPLTLSDSSGRPALEATIRCGP
jgi:hypothetical protein